MTDERRLEQRLQQMGDMMSPDSIFTEAVMARVAQKSVTPVRLQLRTSFSDAVMKPLQLLLAVCGIAIAVTWIWPGSVDNEGWWLAPTSVWAAELQTNIEEASLQGYSCREQVSSIGFGSSEGVSQTLFVASKRYRRDIFEQDRLRESQWYVHGDDGLTMTSVHYIVKTYTVTLDQKAHRKDDPTTRMKMYAQLLTKSGRRVGTKLVEGREAVGFVIASRKIDPEDDKGTATIWLDQAAMMPLRVEVVVDNIYYVQDQFEWNPKLPANTFDPVIPTGFTKLENK